jgi:hypothetical protein
VTVTNTSSSLLNGWTVRWTLPSGQGISQLWNGTVTVDGGGVTVKNADYNGSVAAGASTGFGFIGSGPATPAPTPSCTSP